MRIVGGKYRSRSLHAPAGSTTRPTSDRVREAMFSILQAYAGWQGGRVLDLYAGTGALGLEAVSRGAAHACFVERDRQALISLRGNIRDLTLENSTQVLAHPIDRVARMLEGTYELVFVDPPYADVANAALALSKWLPQRINGVLVFEHASQDSAPIVANMMHVDTRRYGDTAVSFFTNLESRVVA
jgi:16S rRNA (guanine966-N2)-methyltransferase